MADPYYAEIRAFAFQFAPNNWAACDGATMSSTQNSLVYALIGNLYGGTFPNYNLPNLQGQAPVHWSNPASKASTGLPITLAGATGVESVTLDETQMPNHTHQMAASAGSAAQMTSQPTNTSLPARPLVPSPQNPNASVAFLSWQNANPPDTSMDPSAVGPACGTASGAALAHENRQPYLTLMFCICLADAYWPPKPD